MADSGSASLTNDPAMIAVHTASANPSPGPVRTDGSRAPGSITLKSLKQVEFQPTARVARSGLSALGLCILLVTGCQRVGTTWVPAPRHVAAVTWEGRVSAAARANLAFRRLRLAYAVHPREVFRSIEAETLACPNPGRLLTLGELAYRLGQRTTVTSPDESLEWFRDAAAYGGFALADPSCSPITGAEAVTLHNRAVQGCLRLSCEHHERKPSLERLASVGIVVQTADPDLDPTQFDRLQVAEDFHVNGLTMHTIDGLGVPLLAVREMPDRSERTGQDRFYGRRLVPPLTAVLLTTGAPAGGQWRSQPIRLIVYDPLAHSGVKIGRRSMPLAADFTTPLAFQAGQMRASTLELAGVVNPEKLAEKTGIYQIHPYRAGKIPIVFIHGLASSPGAWVPMFNELRGDPVLRDRYQFWFAYYPTGFPAPVSVAKLRGELHDLQKTLDPEGTDPALRNMVVVGHSLGGLVSRMLIQTSGNQVWDSFFTKPPGGVIMTPESREWARGIFFFEPEPTIRRVVFVAAPHRGSSLANQLFGRFSSALVRPSPRIAELRDALTALNGPDVFQPEYRDRMIDSIDNLEWESPMLKTLAGLPLAPGVPYHSIVGNVTSFEDPTRWTDGIVRYSSAHMDGAVSELVVPYRHTQCTTKPQAIAEVRRILLLHLSESTSLMAPDG